MVNNPAVRPPDPVVGASAAIGKMDRRALQSLLWERLSGIQRAASAPPQRAGGEGIALFRQPGQVELSVDRAGNRGQN